MSLQRAFEVVIHGLPLLAWMCMLTELINNFNILNEMTTSCLVPDLYDVVDITAVFVFELFIVLTFPVILVRQLYSRIQKNSETP